MVAATALPLLQDFPALNKFRSLVSVQLSICVLCANFGSPVSARARTRIQLLYAKVFSGSVSSK